MKGLVRVVAILYYISYVVSEIYMTFWIIINKASFLYWLLYSAGLFFGLVLIAGIDYAVSRVSDDTNKRIRLW